MFKNIYNRRFNNVFDNSDDDYVVLKDIILFGPYCIPITSDLKVIMSPLGTTNFAKNRLKYSIKQYGLIKIFFEYIKTKFFKKNYINETIAYLVPRHGWPGLPNYGHWLCENLPQIEIIRHWESLNDQKLKLLLGPTSSRKWLPAFLRFLDYSELDLISQDKAFIRVSKLILPKLFFIHSFSFDSNAQGRQWGGQKLLEKIQRNNNFNNKLVFISRQNMHRRIFTNYDELLPILLKYNFHILNPENYSTEDQISIFSSAKIIAGATGAAFANMIFAKNAAILYSWHIDDKVNCWQNLSYEMGFDYYHIKTKGIAKDNETAINLDLEIDVNHFESTLIDVLDKMNLALNSID